MKIAYFSPLHPVRSGIADYSEELLPWLAKRAELDLFVDGYAPISPVVQKRFGVYDSAELVPRRFNYAMVLYQIGNNICHADAIRLLPRYPGITVLHDFNIHHAIVELTVARGNAAGYVREMGYCYGSAGAKLARHVLGSGTGFPYEQFPLNQRVLDASLGLIVHSSYVHRLVHGLAPELPISVIPHHVLPNSGAPVAADERSQLGLPPDALLFGAFGLATPAKRLDVALSAFARLREREADACFLIVGEVAPECDLRAVITRLGIESSVQITGYVDKPDLIRYINAVDVGVSLRWPTMGETSGTLMRLLSAGKPTIVSNAGAFSEFPDDCVWKVPVGGDEEDRIYEAMLALARDRDVRQAMGQRALSYVTEHHSIEKSAASYIAFIRQILE